MPLQPALNDRERLSHIEDVNDGGDNKRVQVMNLDSTIYTSKLIAQLNPGTTATSVYILPASTVMRFKSLFVCNTSSSDKTYRIFLDPVGTTYNQSTAIFFDATIEAYETKLIESFLVLSTAGGSLAVYASSTDVTFTVSGVEETQP